MRGGQGEGEHEVFIAQQRTQDLADEQPVQDPAAGAGRGVGRVRVPQQCLEQNRLGVGFDIQQRLGVLVSAQRLVGGTTGPGPGQFLADVLDRGPASAGGHFIAVTKAMASSIKLVAVVKVSYSRRWSSSS